MAPGYFSFYYYRTDPGNSLYQNIKGDVRLNVISSTFFVSAYPATRNSPYRSTIWDAGYDFRVSSGRMQFFLGALVPFEFEPEYSLNYGLSTRSGGINPVYFTAYIRNRQVRQRIEHSLTTFMEFPAGSVFSLRLELSCGYRYIWSDVLFGGSCSRNGTAHHTIPVHGRTCRVFPGRVLDPPARIFRRHVRDALMKGKSMLKTVSRISNAMILLVLALSAAGSFMEKGRDAWFSSPVFTVLWIGLTLGLVLVTIGAFVKKIRDPGFYILHLALVLFSAGLYAYGRGLDRGTIELLTNGSAPVAFKGSLLSLEALEIPKTRTDLPASTSRT